MVIFVEYLDGDYAVCRLPDKVGNLIRIPLKELPEGTAPLKVISMRDNGCFVLNDYARETRMKRITRNMRYKKYSYNLNSR